MPMIATSGELITGVEAIPPSLPRLVIGDRRAGQLLALGRVVARRCRHAPDLRSQLIERQRFGMAHHRHLESIARLRRDAGVHGLVAQDDLARRIVVRVALRKLLQHTHQRGKHEWQESSATAPGRALAIQILAQRFELGDVHFLDVGEMRDVALGLAHALRDDAPHADAP